MIKNAVFKIFVRTLFNIVTIIVYFLSNNTKTDYN